MTDTKHVSYKPEFYCHGKWFGNHQRFATNEEAHACAKDRCIWTPEIEDHCVLESNDPVNYKWQGRLVYLKETKEANNEQI